MSHFIVSDIVATRRVITGVSIYLDLPLYLFFCLHRDSYVAPLGVLQVLLLLGGCSAF